MATVQTLIDRYDAIAPAQSKRKYEHNLIPLLDFIKDEAWKILIGDLSEHNYFFKRSQYTSTGQDDYFEPLVSTIRDYALPPDLQRIKEFEIETLGQEGLVFVYRPPDDHEYSQRRTVASASGERYGGDLLYTVYGSDPGTLALADFPEVGMNVRLWYYHKPATWSASTTNIDEFPQAVWNVIVSMAARFHALDMKSANGGGWYRAMVEMITRAVSSMDRVDHGPDVVHGVFEEG